MSKTDRDMWAFYRKWLVQRLVNLDRPFDAYWYEQAEVELVAADQMKDPSRKEYVYDPACPVPLTRMTRELLVAYCDHAVKNP